jgi:hypothetical protein
MNTAEVAIEHVLAGILALCAFALPFVSRPQLSGRLSQNAFIVAALGAAYLFGVVFDRLADTILGPMEHWLRLGIARQAATRKQSNSEGPISDPFPQDQLEFNLRGEEDARVQWMDSLRGRIRTSRALCVLGTPAALGIAVFLLWNTHEARLHWKPHLFVILNLLLVFLAVFGLLLVHWLSVFAKQNRNKKLEERLNNIIPPRTDELGKCKTRMTPWKHAILFTVPYWLMMVNSITVTAWIVPGSDLRKIAIWLGAAAMFGLALAAWSQITSTYMAFINRGTAGRP